MAITKMQALEDFREMYRSFTVDHIASKLADDFCFHSERPFVDIRSKEEYLALIRKNLKAVKANDTYFWTAIGYWGDEPCLAVSLSGDYNYQTTRVVEVKGDQITHLELYLSPTPRDLDYG